MSYTTSTRIIDLTVGELQEIISGASPQPINAIPDEWGFGLKAIQSALGCGKNKACEIRKDRKYKTAISQKGKIIRVNITKLKNLSLQA